MSSLSNSNTAERLPVQKKPNRTEPLGHQKMPMADRLQAQNHGQTDRILKKKQNKKKKNHEINELVNKNEWHK